MDDLPLVERIVRTCAEGLDVPVTVKIRVFPELQKTIAYAQMLERAGASLIAVHGRLREQKKSKGADANWDVIKVGPAAWLSLGKLCHSILFSPDLLWSDARQNLLLSGSIQVQLRLWPHKRALHCLICWSQNVGRGTPK